MPLFKRVTAIQTAKDMQLQGLVASMQQNQAMQQAQASVMQGPQQQGAVEGSQGGGYNPTVALQPGDMGNAVGESGGRRPNPSGF